MRVLIIGIHYRPDVTGSGPYTAGLAEHLAARGDDVTVLAGLPHYPTWRIAAGTPRTLLRRERLRGVTVIRAAHYVPVKQTATQRALYEGTFGITAFLASIRVPTPNVVLGMIPNLSSGILARITSARLGVPYGLMFQNLVRPGADQAGVAGGTAVARATGAAEAWSARDARMIGVASELFVPYLTSLGVSDQRIAHVPNWARLAAPDLTVADTRQRFGWINGTQVVLHAGNMGVMQGLEQVVCAAGVAAQRGDPVNFVFCGDGNQASAIRAAAEGLANVSFLGLQTDGMYASLLMAADALLVSERATEVDFSLPSKLTSYFAAGRPIVAAVPSDGATSREVQRADAGLTVPVGDPELLLDTLARLRTEPGLAAELAQAGLIYADTNLRAAACLARGTALIDKIAA